VVGGPTVSCSVVRPNRARLALPRAASSLRSWRLPLIAAGSVAAWLPIVDWYSLAANQTNTHFAFEKISGGFASPVLRATLLLFLLLALLYLLGYRLLANQPDLTRSGKLAIFVMFLGPALANLFIYPVGALDVFNYLVELKLAYGYGQNPYLVTFAAYRSDPYALPAFLVNMPLFYGPVWLLIYGLPVAVVGFASIITLLNAVRVLNLLVLALTGVVIVRSQEERRQGWLAAYLFLANPLVVFESVGNGHNDVLMTLFLVAALVTYPRRSAFAGPLLGLSALVKLFTAVLAPLFLTAMVRERWGRRRLAAAASLTALALVVTVAPFWAGGEMLDGLRRGTIRSQQMDHVSLLSLAQQAARDWPTSAWLAPLLTIGNGCVPNTLMSVSGTLSGGTPPCQRRWLSLAARKSRVTDAAAVIFALLALPIVVAVARGRPLDAAAVDTLLLFFLFMTKLYPWYLIPIIALLALRGDRLGLRYLFAATALGLAYYPAYVFARFDHHWPELTIHLFLALFLTVPILVFLGAELWRFVGDMVTGSWAHGMAGGVYARRQADA
jgi:hypothetical protein